MLFEFFEASAKREAVLATKTGAVAWTFPGVAIHLPSSVLDNNDFLESLATFLEQASIESTKKLSEHVFKAGADLWENRETPDPSLISSLLAALLEANGTRITPTLLNKRVRDEVLWSNAQAPWRRLPCWLVLRVSLSRYLAMMLGDAQTARVQYKAFMCIVHSSLLNDIMPTASLEDLEFLKAKLCRRLFKMDRDRVELHHAGQLSHDSLLRQLSPQFRQIIESTKSAIEHRWSSENYKATKSNLPLNSQASPEDLRLSLKASRQYLREAQRRFQTLRNCPRPQPSTHLIVCTPEQQLHEFAKEYFGMFAMEDKVSRLCNAPISEETNLTRRCQMLYTTLLGYIDRVKTLYDNDMEQKSLMLLLVMEIWVTLDRIACMMFPLLLDFHPIFRPELVEILRISSLSDVARVREVQRYLTTRENMCRDKHATILDDPGTGCFAERYFDESPEADTLNEVLEEIQEAANEERESKEREWRKSSAEYEALTKEFDLATCFYISNENGTGIAQHEPRFCRKCQLNVRLSRFRKIRIFESPLPESATLSKVVVFELRCPRAFAAYRDATWAIFHRLATVSQEKAIEPRLCLGDYSELQPFAAIPGQVSLASTTKSCMTVLISYDVIASDLIDSSDDSLEYEKLSGRAGSSLPT